MRVAGCMLFLALGAGASYAQTVSSSVSGALFDPAGAAVAGASCKLTSQATGLSLTTSSNQTGLFVFATVPAGVYTLVVEIPGFKILRLSDIVVMANEIRSLGNLTLQLGEVKESVMVTADPAAIQLASGEKAGVVTGEQLDDLALKGRDFFALVQTLPGIVDTNEGREITSNTSNTGIYINGGRDNQKEFAVDGMVAHDTHSNGSVPFQPNMDSIAEVRILTSNYQAEFGRNSAGSIRVITRGGGRQLRGSAYDFYRHENLNANNFFNNRTGTARPPYRYRVTGYSLGGPISIPRRLNTAKDRLFFFWSQEFSGMKRDYGARFVNTPSERERNGDFSQSFDTNGRMITVRDPLTRAAFPGNAIPKSRFNSVGQAILNFYPLPNYTDPDPQNLYRWNYRSVQSNNNPRRNDLIRVDANVSPTLRIFYRFIHDADPKDLPWGDWKTGSVNYLISPVHVDNRGFGHLFHVTRTFSPTLVNEAMFGATQVARDFDMLDPSTVARSRMGNVPQWFKDERVPDYIPNITFGGQPANPVNSSLALIPNSYRNIVYVFNDQVSKIVGSHSFKAGITVERSLARTPSGGPYRGLINFSRDANNPSDSGHSFANALLGNFTSYQESNRRLETRQVFWNTEWFIQDNWRLHRRLTVDFGVRFYHMPPIRELSNLAATFDPALYDRAKAPLLYYPARDATNQRVAKDPLTGAVAVLPLIGAYVPGSGDPDNGMAVGGVNGYPPGLYTRPWASYGPRFGFAWDVLGTGRTALRGGWGWFHDTGENNSFAASIGNRPVSRTPTLYYGNLDTFMQAKGADAPNNISSSFGHKPPAATMNYSFGIQQQAWKTLFDVSYVGALARHLLLVRNINPIPMYARFDPRNEDPTQPGRPLPDNFMRPYAGYGDINNYQNVGTSNYHSLQIGVNRRFTRGLRFGAAYTRAKTLGVAASQTATVSPYFSPRWRNYGPLSYDRTNVLVVNFTYELPKVGTRMGWRPAKWALDRWLVSGITTFTSGAPVTPGLSTTDGADFTGSSEAARVSVAGDPHLPKSERTFYRNFRTEAFVRPAPRDFGNAGVGILRGPGVNNWNLSATKRFPLRRESRYLQFRLETYNTWNHTQFSAFNSTARFDAAGRPADPNFGAFTAARAARVIQLSLRMNF